MGTEDVEISLNLNPQDVKEELGLDSIDNTVRLCVVLNDFIEQEGNILVLCGGRGTTLKLTSYTKMYFEEKGMLPDMSCDEEIQRAIEIVKLENGENDPLIECLKFGICYHNSGLSSLVKETIEELVRNNRIKLIFATTTLAQGMNFPINTVIFDTVKLRNKGDLSNAEFWNIAGRAGRAYKDKEELKNEIHQSFEKYISEFDTIPEALKDKRVPDVDRTPAENLAYQVGWTTLLLKWETDEKRGMDVKTPSEQFRWNQLGGLYQWFTDTYAHLSLAELKGKLSENIAAI